jgi:hypothetical protein
MASLFLSAEEAALTGLFLGRQAELFEAEPAFGTAGGPDRAVLSDLGRERAYNIASVYRMALGIAHIEALTTIAGYGAAGMPLMGMSPSLHCAAHALTDVSITDRFQNSLAVGQGGDEAARARIRDENRLIWLDQTGGKPDLDVWRITTTGLALIAAATAVEESMLAHHIRTGGDMASGYSVSAT